MLNYVLLSALCGVLVGASEIMARYRDEPFRAAFWCGAGLVYLSLNAIISVIAYYFLCAYGDKILIGLKDDNLLRSIVAGFGGMIILRSKLFNFKTEAGEDYAFGPDAVLSVFLKSIDRGIDRARSAQRLSLVARHIDLIEDPEAAPDLFITSLASFQNLTDSDKQDIVEIIKDLRLKDPKLKLMALSFGFLNIGGQSNYKKLMTQLKHFIDSFKKEPPLEEKV